MNAVRHLLDRSVGLAQQAVLVALPHGGQRRARANAWTGVLSDGERRADRLSAMRAVRDLALPEADVPAYAVGGR